jgi:peptidoglycan/xylan/chitin deacetylase (PgdA/CDA1 family)
MRKKDILMWGLSAVGVMKLRWRFLPPALFVFNYHRVGNREECGFNRCLFSCTVEQFREQLAVLKDRFDIVTVDRLANFARQGYAGGRPLGLVTFDDGYADNFRLAFPVLKQMDIPAVFFLPTEYIGARRLLWSDTIAWMLRNSRHSTIALPYAHEPYSLAADRLEPNIREILRHVRRGEVPIDEQVDRIRQVCGGVCPSANNNWPLFMTWEQVREMRSAGMDIGSHTHSHTPLARLSADRQRAELMDSRAVLEGELREPIRAVAYPVGDHTAYTAETCRIAREVGYELGFNFRRHANRFPVHEALDIGRLAVDYDTCTTRLMSRVCFPKVFAN